MPLGDIFGMPDLWPGLMIVVSFKNIQFNLGKSAYPTHNSLISYL